MRTVNLGLAPPAPDAGGQQSQRLLIQLVLALNPTDDRRDPRQVLGGGDLRGLTRRLAWPSESQGALPRLVADPEQDVELREPLGSAALGPGSTTLGRFEQPGAPAIRLNVAEGEERAEVDGGHTQLRVERQVRGEFVGLRISEVLGAVAERHDGTGARADDQLVDGPCQHLPPVRELEVHLDPLGLEGAHGRWPSKNAARRARPWGDCRGSAPAMT